MVLSRPSPAVSDEDALFAGEFLIVDRRFVVCDGARAGVEDEVDGPAEDILAGVGVGVSRCGL